MNGTTSLNVQEVWEEALAVIRSRVSRQSFEAWFRPLTLGKLEENRLQILLPNRFFKEWFEEHYLGLLRSALEDLLFNKVEIKLLLPDKDAAAANQTSEEPHERRTPRRPRESGAQLNPRYTFDSFVVGTSNQFAHAACMAVGEQLAKTYNPLFIYGGVGLGKTHLLHAIGNALRQSFPRSRVLYTTAEEFVNDYINSIHHRKTDDFRAKYRNLDCLLIDDIQFIIAKEQSEQEFFHTFNTLFDSRRQIVITSDRVPKEMTPYERRLVSRFEWGQVADITPPDLETRIAILRKKSELEQFYVPDDVILFVASTVKTNIRLLEGSLIRLKAFASMTGSSLTVDGAREILKDSLPHDVSSPVQMETIQRLVAHKYSLDIKDLKGQQRTASIALPRQLAMYLASVLTDHSSTDIGRAFGGRDHTTVLHARKKIQKMLDEDPFFLEMVNKLQSDIKSVEN